MNSLNREKKYPSFYLKRIIKQLFDYRVTHKITQEEVAKWVGVTYPMIGYWEKGKYSPNLSQFEDWCRFLGFVPVLEELKSE